MEKTIFDKLVANPQTAGEQSLVDCIAMLRRCAYNISEGPSFVRTPMVMPRLEKKYYVEDLQKY